MHACPAGGFVMRPLPTCQELGELLEAQSSSLPPLPLLHGAHEGSRSESRARCPSLPRAGIPGLPLPLRSEPARGSPFPAAPQPRAGFHLRRKGSPTPPRARCPCCIFLGKKKKKMDPHLNQSEQQLLEHPWEAGQPMRPGTFLLLCVPPPLLRP